MVYYPYRTTWCIFPFTLIAMCWSKLFAQCKCGRCGILCCARNKSKQLARAKLLQSDPQQLQVPPNMQELNVRGSAGRMSNMVGSPMLNFARSNSLQRQDLTVLHKDRMPHFASYFSLIIPRNFVKTGVFILFQMGNGKDLLVTE